MLKIKVEDRDDIYDKETKSFKVIKGAEITLEHSLISVSKWEAKYHKPFLEMGKELNGEQLLYYIKCMTLTQCVRDEVYMIMSEDNIKEIQEYIADPMTATWFNEVNINNKTKGKGHDKQIVTSELIYYWMIAQNIPMECEKWHLNRLMTLIKVCSIKNEEAQQGGKKSNKMSRSELAMRNQALNAQRRAKLHSKG